MRTFSRQFYLNEKIFTLGSQNLFPILIFLDTYVFLYNFFFFFFLLTTNIQYFVNKHKSLAQIRSPSLNSLIESILFLWDDIPCHNFEPIYDKPRRHRT